MNKTRFSSLILGVMLIFGIYISLEVFGPSLKAGKTSRPYVGMGDLRRFEAQQAQRTIPVTGGQATSRPYVGMGDLRRFEAQQAQRTIPVTGGQASSRPYVGMGDLRRVEAQQNRNNDNGCSAMIRLVYSQNWPWC